MKVYYFDLGLYKGVELGWMVDRILPSLGVSNFEAYGFEACHSYATKLQKKYSNNSKVHIVNKAISNTSGKQKLYHAGNLLGHSIFATKRNVTSKYEEVDGIVFSDWLMENIKDYKESLIIMKVNIEGAEWHLFNDLVSNQISHHVDIYCGAGHDVEKISELADRVEEYYQLLKENNIFLHRFSEYMPHKNANLSKMIGEKYVF